MDTPGIKNCIDAITNDPSQAMQLTNKANNMFVVTDGTGFSMTKDNWKPEYGIVYTEAKSYYYKTCYDIDAYPLVLHHIKCESAKDIYSLLKNMTTTYVACELYKVSRSKLDPLNEMLLKHPLELVIATDDTRGWINERLKNLNCYEISENFVLGVLIRACMDYYVWGTISILMISECLEDMAKKFTLQDPGKHREIQKYLYEKAVEYIKQNDLNYGNEPIHLTKLMSCAHKEQKKPQKTFMSNLTSDKKMDEPINRVGGESVYLHKKHKGMMKTARKFELFDNRWIDIMLSDENIQRLFLHVKDDPESLEKLSCKKNYCTVVTNGSALLDKSFVGGQAALPLIESRCLYLREFTKIDTMPICFKDFDKFEQSKLLEMMSPTFGAMCLENIKAPDCFFIENYLRENAHCPVYHAGQHSASIVVLAALINS